MNFPKYPAYKDSEVEWIGEIPVGWNLLNGRRLFADKKISAQSGDEQLSATQKYGVIPQKDFMKNEDQKVTLAISGIDNFRHVDEGDFVISLRSFQGGIEYSYYKGCVSPAYTVLCRKNKINDIFWSYLFKSRLFIDEINASSEGIRDGKTIRYEQFGKIAFAIPPLPEQQAIASFLDRECGKIDGLIAEQERLIALLAEKRQAVISHAVTKGLNPNVPMKDSGIPWIGMVPERWEILSLNKVVRDFVDYRGVTPNKVESGVPLITASCIKHGRIDHSIDPVFITKEEYNRRMTRGFPRKGDVILTTEAPLGEVAIVEDELISPGQRMILFKLDEKMSNFYMRAYYLSDIGRQELRSRASGSTASGIRADRLRASAIPVPPLNEQKEICAYIDRKTSAFESLEQQIRYELDLLKERRAALISAAVTGKIDVRAQSKALAA